MSGFVYLLMTVTLTAGCLQPLYAQNKISGKIKNQEGTALTGANIIVQNSAIGTASDAEGNYSIRGLKNGEYLIRVSFFGYETTEKRVDMDGRDVTLDFELEETSIDLNAVVVTGTRTEKSLKNTPVLTQSIGIRELVSKDATDITQALEMAVPGIEFSHTAMGKSISLQGIAPQYMLFLVDGERLAGETYGDIDYSRINMAGIERIEVIKGAASTLYGSNALGGVINIITKTPAEKFSHAVASRFSGYNSQNHQLSIGAKQGKFTTQTSLVFDKTDGYDLVKGDTYRTQEREDVIVLNEKITFAPSAAFLVEGNLSWMDKNRDNTALQLYDRKNRNFTYVARATWFPITNSSIALSWNSDNYELFNKTTPDSLVSDYDNLYNHARLLGNIQLTEWNLLTAGAEYISENLTAPRNNIDNKTNTDYVVFAQEDVRLGKKVNVVGGFRAHNNSQYGWHFTPQLSAMYRIWHFSFRGNFGMGYKTPTMKEKYMSFKIPAPGPPMFLVGYEDLEPETSKYASLSMEYTRSGVSFSISAFHNDISDMISENLDEYSVKPGGILEYAYRNYDHVTVRGVDVLLKTRVIRNLLFTGMVSFSKKYDQVENKAFDNVRNFTGKFNADYHMQKGFYGLNLNLQSNFYGEKSIDLMDDVTHQTSKVVLESFSHWKFTTTHTFYSNYYFKAGVDNIFDFTDKSGGYNTGTPGRTFFIGLGLNM